MAAKRLRRRKKRPFVFAPLVPFCGSPLAGSLFAMMVACATGWAAELPPEQIEFFESKIRPILAESCYKCHSDEAGKSKADLRLDSRDALRTGGTSGVVIVPGDPDKSLLIEAVRYKNEDLQMPPADEGGRLSAEKIALLEEWVRLGAPDPRSGGKPHPMDIAGARKHWAFQPVSKPAAPAVKNKAWLRTPVDAFILAQFEAKMVAPSKPADPRTLLRRVTYDLTGLPPSPAEMEAFLGDRSPEAYDKVVERLLSSPAYGERWGRFWLDIARYADTKGYLAGNVERRFTFSHTYRDYVIRAFNEDKPFDRFIVEQIAADQLPLGEDKSALAALGFLTLGRRFLNNQNDIIDDRIDVVTRGLMGLTVTCARCHDHKFDPIPTKDYYSLHGVFASSEEPAEKPLLGPLADSPAYQQFLKKTAGIEAKIKERERSEVEKFLGGVRANTGNYLLGAHDAKSLPEGEKIDVFAGVRKLNAEVLKRFPPWLEQAQKENHPVLAPWFALAALPAENFATKAAELISQWKERVAARASVPESGEGRRGARESEFNRVVIEALAKAEKPVTSLKEVAAIYNQVFADADKPAPAAAPVDVSASGSGRIEVPSKSEMGPRNELHSLTLVATTAGSEKEQIYALLKARDAPWNLGYEETMRMLKRQIDGKRAPLRREIEALNWTEPGAPLRAMALVDKAAPANSQIFLRGNPANKGGEVPRQFLEVLSDEARVPFEHGSGRLDLAREIASPKNPLTARVFVNRVWGWHLGQALVRTPSDFGVRTVAPVHQPLLDWLAASFMEHGWSVKQLHRWIVRSNVYQQSSDEHPRAAALDPDNQLVHRFNRRRLEFEALRDTVLAVSGSLDRKAGGLPDDLTKEPFPTRRTVYGFIDRQNLPGLFRTFDFPNPDVSSAQRFTTTVPQQALFMMNSPFTQEQARQLVRRVEISGAESEPEKIRTLYQVAYQRAPDAKELEMAQAFLHRPAIAAEPRPVISAGWKYGYGSFDPEMNRVRDFQPMMTRHEERMIPGEKFPSPDHGHLSLTATGGHPGRAAGGASIRRWTAPAVGKVKIEGTLGHANASGDGVRGRIVSSGRGKVGEWTVHNTKAETKVDLDVQGGETIDFVVDSLANGNSDTYTWAPSVAFMPDPEAVDTAARTWNAKKDFETAAKPVAPLTRWEEFAQVLLLSNELAFVD
jgi:hypothetical protein